MPTALGVQAIPCAWPLARAGTCQDGLRGPRLGTRRAGRKIALGFRLGANMGGEHDGDALVETDPGPGSLCGQGRLELLPQAKWERVMTATSARPSWTRRQLAMRYHRASSSKYRARWVAGQFERPQSVQAV